MDYNAFKAAYPDAYKGWDDAAGANDFKATAGVGKGGYSGGAYNKAGSFQFPDIKLSDIGGSAVDFAKNLDTGINSAYDTYAGAVRNMESPLAIYDRLETQAGLPELRKTATTLSGQINDIEDTLRRVEPDVSATSNNSFMTEAQRRGVVTARKAPLIENLGWLGQSAGRVQQGIQQATSDIGTKVGLAVQGQDRQLEPLKQKIQLATESAARMMTGFTADRQANLDILLAKISSQQRVSELEMQQANELARQEKDYLIKQEQLNSETQIVETDGRKRLVNSRTGQVIADLGSSKAPNTGAGTGATTFSSTSINNKPSTPAPTFLPKLTSPNSNSSATLKDKVGY